MSALTMQKTFMTIATKEASAAIASPLAAQASMISFQFKLCDGIAANLDTAGQKWREVAEKLQKTATDLQDAVSSIPAETWTADDRKAYEQQVKQVCEQLEIAATFYQAVGIALTAYAYALLTYAVFALAMGTTIVALAVAADAALASVVGAPALAGIEAAAATCLTVTWAATGILAGAAQMAAMVFQGGAALTALLEYKHGNKQALSDFKHAEALGASTALANLGQNAINAGLAYVDRNNVPGMKSKSPLSAIDIDADVDKDEDLHVGAGAKINDKVTVGGRLELDHEDGIVGGGAEVKYKAGNNEVGANVGYEDDKLSYDVSDKYSNDYKAGGTGGEGGSVGVKGNWNPHTGEYETKGYGSASYAGGDVVKEEGGVTHDAEGKTTWSDKTTSWYGDSERKY